MHTPFWRALFILFLFFLTAPPASDAQKCYCGAVNKIPAAADTGSARHGFTQGLLAEGSPFCKAMAYERMAKEYTEARKFDSAEQVLQQAERIYTGSNCGDSVLLKLYKEWASLYYTKADFAKAQEYTFKLLDLAQAGGDPYEIGGTYTMIAQLFNQTGQADKGITYARLAVPYAMKTIDPRKKADLLFKLSKRYLWHFQDTQTDLSLDSSELFSRMQLVIAGQNNLTSSLAAAYTNLEGVAWEREEYDKIILYLDSALLYTGREEYGNLAVNYYDRADLFIELKDYVRANRMADSALYYHQRSGNIAYIAEVYDLQSRIASESGDYKTAFIKKEAARSITDSIRNIEKTKQVTELERKYTQAKNEKTIQELAQQKRIYFLLAIAGLLALAALSFFLRQQSLGNKQKILETEQRLNRARMNPHFFFNALASLQTFALQGKDGASIAGSLSKFSHIMRETLESTYKEYVTIEQDTDFISKYLELQQTRFPQKFEYSFRLSPDLEPDQLLIPSMILQPFVENSIEHGFAGIDYPGLVTLDFSLRDNNLHITIADNGKGLSPGPKEQDEHISRAGQIIKDRIYLLNLRLKTKAAFSIANNANGKGVRVDIRLPLLYKDMLQKGMDS